MEALNYVMQIIRAATITDVIDIAIVAYVIYRLFKFVRNTSAGKLIKGFILLMVIMQVSDWLDLHVVNYILNYVMKNGILAVIIIFQPEIRRGLEQVGKSKLTSFLNMNAAPSVTERAILQTVDSCTTMSWTKTGALIVFERMDKLDEIMRSGTLIEAEVSSELIKNIFYPKAPLHDGAMIVRNGHIYAAGCVLPLSAKRTLSKDLGTRHRAGVGMSEVADSVVVIVSEETGAISVAIGGILKRNLSPDMLERLLRNELMGAEDSDDKSSKKRTLSKPKWKGMQK